ncbi:MAG: S-methyl-5'-thioadenosine phosphorylase [Chloroflexota bacterium]
MENVEIAVIGGSGLYDIPDVTDKKQYDIDTPFGKPSAPVTVGTLSEKRVAFLPRHGTGHTLTPTTVPYRANIYALKQMGVRFIIAVSACGSLHEDYEPGHLAIPDQLYDNTKSRHRTFFETGLVAHVGVAEPFDAYLRNVLQGAVEAAGGIAHDGGLFFTIEGPRFSTRGESNIFRSWGGKLIGMTTSPEAFLAAEAEIAYGCIAQITDYDVWHETEEPVTVEQVMKTAAQNLTTIREALPLAIAVLDETTERPVHNSLANAIMTAGDALSDDMRKKLAAIVGRYV